MGSQLSIFLLIIPILGLLHTAAFALFWLINGLYYADVNNFLFTKLGKRLDYIRLTQAITYWMLLWSIVLLYLLLRTEYQPGWFVWLYLVAFAIYLFLFYGSFWFLFSQSPVQWVRLWRLVVYFRFVLDLMLLVGLFFFMRAVGASFPDWDAEKIISGIACLLISLFLWSLPLISPPGLVYKNPLPPKPRLIAHRGASMLASENTLSAAKRAEALGVYGLEVDIRISLDGVPFLMHDNSLLRTTDVASVFPGREADRPEDFTLAELKQLNAGEWFCRSDPYKTIAKELVTPAEIKKISQERIPTLAEVLGFLKENKQVFVFDLISPPPGHPFSAQFFQLCFSQIHQAGLDSRIWFLAKGDEKEFVGLTSPDMVLAYGAAYANPPASRTLIEQGYQVINVEYGLSLTRIPQYQEAGLKVNLYVVDEPWMFSQAWLAGVDSLTTNNVHSLVAINRPAFGLTKKMHLLIWGLVGLIGFGIALFSWIPR